MARLKTKGSSKKYLDLVRFDPQDLKGFVANYIVNVRLIILILIGIILFGLWGFTSLPRRLNPEVQIPIVFVSTVLPGASPEDVESLITIPIEDAIEGVDGISNITSSSRENFSAVIVEFESNVDPVKSKDDLKSEIDDIIGDLPEDATTPSIVALDFEDVPIWTFAIETNQDLASLTRFADNLKARLESNPSIKEVFVAGLESQEIQILVKIESIIEFGITQFQVAEALKTELNSYPGGIVATDTNNFAVTIDPIVETLDDIRDIQLSIQGQLYKLSDIAIVQERSEPNQPKSFLSNSDVNIERTVSFSVFKNPDVDIDQASLSVKSDAMGVVEEFENRFEIVSILDSGELIEEQFGDLFRNMRTTIILVFITLLLFLGIRQASIASFAIPLSFLIAFGVMNLIGITLNFLSMFALILSLGLLVDTAIVVISAMTSYYQTKRFTVQQVGILVWKDFFAPIMSSTATTIWAFVPLLLATGLIGEFIKTIPIVVTTTLLASTFVSLLITLPLMMLVLKSNIPHRVVRLFKILIATIVVGTIGILYKDSFLLLPILITMSISFIIFYKFGGHSLLRAELKKIKGLVRLKHIFSNVFSRGLIDLNPITNQYERIVTVIVNSNPARVKTLLIVAMIFVFSISLIPLGYVKNVFFTPSDQDVIFISVELPPGTNYSYTTNEAISLLEDIRKIQYVDTVITEVGSVVDLESTSTQLESNLVKYSLLLSDDRDISSLEIAQNIRDQFASYSEGDLSVVELSDGPPTGADIVINLRGDDLSLLSNFADDTIQYLESQPGVTDINKSIKPGTSKIAFVPDRQKILDAGLTVEQVGIWLRTYISGFTLDEARITKDEEQTISFRISTDIQDPESLAGLTIPVQGRSAVPLLSLGSLELRANPTSITRDDNKRTISVSATVESGFNIGEVGGGLEEFADTNLDLPTGYEWSTGGVNEENQKSVQSILQAMVLAFVLILATMVVQFRSYRKALIVLSVIPLALSGVFIIFALTGIALSFPALIGVLALFGIVVNNAILMVERIGQNQKIGINFKDSIIGGSTGRLRPILLSSLTTIIGITPITLSDPVWQGLGGAIIAGLVFSGTITLFFVPVLYYYFFPQGEGASVKA